MKNNFSDIEIRIAGEIWSALNHNRTEQAIYRLETLKDEMYTAIPTKQRIGRGITWVVQRIARLFTTILDNDTDLRNVGLNLSAVLVPDHILLGVPIFIMGMYGENHPHEISDFFAQMADSPDWIIREFAQGGFRPVITPNRDIILPWLKRMAEDESANRRRFSAETLRPVTDNRWMYRDPEYSLGVLRLMFLESHPYPRTSVGNNLSDLSRRQPELIYTIVQELKELNNDNSNWIAFRACRNLIKTEPRRVMDLLGLEEYHYKERHYYKSRTNT
jgi:3-methyladenine DNA glycosylase AlkC